MGDSKEDLFIRRMQGEGFDPTFFDPSDDLVERACEFARAFATARNGFLVSQFRSGTYLEHDGAGLWFDGATVNEAFRRLFQSPATD